MVANGKKSQIYKVHSGEQERRKRGKMFGLFDDSYGKLFAPFDGNTKLPVLFTAFSILYFFFSTRLNTLRIFPKQQR